MPTQVSNKAKDCTTDLLDLVKIKYPTAASFSFPVLFKGRNEGLKLCEGYSSGGKIKENG